MKITAILNNVEMKLFRFVFLFDWTFKFICVVREASKQRFSDESISSQSTDWVTETQRKKKQKKNERKIDLK